MRNGNNENGLFILLLVVMVVLMCIGFVGLFFMMKDADSSRSEIDELKEENSSKKCSAVLGKYYGELIDGNVHMKQTYVFSADGTYITYVENGGATNGAYTISNGIIKFVQKPELGPSTAEPYNYSYNVSDDCKSITAYSGDSEYKLNLVSE